MSDMLAAALSYAARGWYVFPLYGIKDGRCECLTNCGSPGKHPRTKNGLRDATVDAVQIRSWWIKWADANIGIATGAASGIYVIDIDNKRSVDLGNGILISEGEASLRQKDQDLGYLPATLTSLTGSGGTHLIFSYPTIPTTSEMGSASFGNRAGILPSVDTRGDGGYIVAPPSLHQSGTRYRWQKPLAESSIASLPSSWLTFLAAPSTTQGHSALSLEPASDFRLREGEGRHEWLFKMGSLLRGQHGLSEIGLSGALTAYNERHLSPPLEPKEVQHIVRNCLKYGAGLPPRPVDTEWPDLEGGLARAESFTSFMSRREEAPAPLIEGILHAGECLILGGQPNVGKTWLLMDMMLGIAEGTRWLDYFAASQGTVLFVDEEGSRWANQQRFDMLLQGRVRSVVELPIFATIGAGIRLDEKKGYTAVARLVEEHRPAIVFMDSLVRMHGGNESDNRVMAEFFRRIKPLMLAYKTAFVFTHHISKPPAEGRREPWAVLRGASDIQGFPDSVLVVSPGIDSAEVKVVHTKMRHGRRLDPFHVRLQIDNADGTAELAYVRDEASSSINRARQTIQSKLAAGPATTDQLAFMTGFSPQTVREHLRIMETGGLVTSDQGHHQLRLNE